MVRVVLLVAYDRQTCCGLRPNRCQLPVHPIHRICQTLVSIDHCLWRRVCEIIGSRRRPSPIYRRLCRIHLRPRITCAPQTTKIRQLWYNRTAVTQACFNESTQTSSNGHLHIFHVKRPPPQRLILHMVGNALIRVSANYCALGLQIEHHQYSSNDVAYPSLSIT